MREDRQVGIIIWLNRHTAATVEAQDTNIQGKEDPESHGGASKGWIALEGLMGRVIWLIFMPITCKRAWPRE